MGRVPDLPGSLDALPLTLTDPRSTRRRWVSARLPVETRDTEYSVSPLKRLGTSTGLIAERAASSLRCGPQALTGRGHGCVHDIVSLRPCSIRARRAAQEPGQLYRCARCSSCRCSRGGLALRPALCRSQRDAVYGRCPRDVVLQPPGVGSSWVIDAFGCAQDTWAKVHDAPE